MPPKPGFYYYDGARAAKVYLLIAVIGIGAYLSKHDVPSVEELFYAHVEEYLRVGLKVLIYGIRIVGSLFLLCVLSSFLLRQIRRMLREKQMSFPEKPVPNVSDRVIEEALSPDCAPYTSPTFPTEPDPSDYEQREKFSEALREYAKVKGYKPGWVYYRMKEMWP